MTSRVTLRIAFAFLASMLMATLALSPALAAPPVNDDFDGAVAATAVPFSHSVNTDEATSAEDDPSPRCGNESSSRSVWYAFTPTEAMRVSADTQGSNYDTILSVWTGSRGSLQAVTCNDDYTNTASKVYFNVSAGQTYYLMVSSFEGAGGDLNFSIDEVPENLELSVSVDDKAWVNAGTGRATVTGELTCSEPATVAIELSIGQGNRDGSGYLPVDCDGNERWLLQAFGRFNAGRAGIDITAYWTDDTSVRATASLVANLRACTIIGSLGDDSISGSSGNDKICSLAGDDTLRGKGGNDQLRGHDGDDVAIGGPGDDLLTGGYGLDELRAGRGDDALYGDAGADTLSGGPGKDKCIGGPGRDVLRSCERRN